MMKITRRFAGALSLAFLWIPLLAVAAFPFWAQQSEINGCYQKNNGQLRIAHEADGCQPSELAVSWNLARPASRLQGRVQGRAKTWEISALATLGGTENFAYAINDRGDIVGSSRLEDDRSSHAFLYRQGQITDLAPIDSGNIQTGSPTGINNYGQIASGLVVSGVYLPAIYDSTTQRIATLGSLGRATSYGFSGVATAINNRGEAVGYSYLDGINRHAFLFSNNTMSDIGSFGGYSVAMDINDSGAVVGFASDRQSGRAHAFLFSNGEMTDIDPFGDSDFGSSESYARGINNRGQVVGEGLLHTDAAAAFHAFLSSSGTARDLGTLPGGRNSYAGAVSERGQVVGIADIPYTDTCRDPDTGISRPCVKYKLSAFLYSHGVMSDLNTLIPSDSGWELIWAFDISSEGRIVGYGLLNGMFRAFTMMPSSEGASTRFPRQRPVDATGR